jgi:hypothetical protein
MTEPVKKWDHVTRWGDHLQIKSTMMGLSETGKYVLATDYERLEQEFADLAERYGELQTGEGHMTHRVIAERDTALQLLAQCQEHLHPHRDAVLWGQVVEALRCAPTK